MISNLEVALLCVGSAIVAGVGTFLIYRWALRTKPQPWPEPLARTSDYLVRWESEHGRMVVYEGTDPQAAKRAYYGADPWVKLGVPKGGVVELWDGPLCRGSRAVNA